MANDLVFRRPPPAGPPNDLVFGVPFEAPPGDAWLSGHLALPALQLRGDISVKSPPSARVGGALQLPALLLRGAAVYDSAVERPLRALAIGGWQVAEQSAGGAAICHQVAQPRAAGAAGRWQAARQRAAGVQPRWQDAERMRRSAGARHQDAMCVQLPGVPVSWQDAQRWRRDAVLRWEEARELHVPSVSLRWQEALRYRRQAGLHWQSAGAVHVGHVDGVQSARPVSSGAVVRWQDAMWPRPGRSNIGPQPHDPCYVPSTELVFAGGPIADNVLVFVCRRHGDGPGPEPGETIVVPVRRIYTVINTAILRRVDGNRRIPNTAMSLTIDVDSWTWGFTARVPGAALPDLEPSSSGEPVELEAVINGVAYRALVESISRDRVFGRSDLTITGRGKAAMLDAPYSPAMTFGNASAARTAQQLANDVLTLNGVSIGWDVDWQPEDWLVPAGAWAHQGSYMSALNAIASAAGGYIQPHRTAQELSFLLRYPVAPWDWAGVTPDFELPAAVVQKEGVVWTDKPAYNRVFVSGVQSGVLGQVTRAGTAGDLEAPMVTDALISTAVAARQRGLPVLADVGRQAAVTLRMPVLAETRIIPPGKFVRYIDGGTARIGLVRSTSAETARADKKLTVWQTLGVETHVHL